MLIDHPASARVLEFAESHAPPFLVMEGSGSAPLGDSLRDRVPMPEAEAVSLVLSLAWATAEAHRLGLTHGGISTGHGRDVAREAAHLDFTGTLTGPAAPAFQRPVRRRSRAWPGPALAAGWLDRGDRPPSAGCGFEGNPGLRLGRVGRDAWDRSAASRDARGRAVRPPGGPRSGRKAGGHGRRDAVHAADRDDGVGGRREGGSNRRGRRPRFPLLGSGVGAGFSLSSSGPANGSRVVNLDVLTRENLGRYRLLEKIGQGGMGSVFRGEDRADGTVVALKVLRPEWPRSPGPCGDFARRRGFWARSTTRS